MKRKILLIEDEQGLIFTLQDRLVSEGYALESASDGQLGFELALKCTYDLIILDLMLPHKGGLDICRDLRTQGIKIPVIMLTAKSQLFDKVVGLKIGADDYLTKPFEMEELLARIEALLRRTRTDAMRSGDIYEFGNIKVDLKNAEVFKKQKILELSAKEYQLLKYMLEHNNEVLSRDQLLDAVWDYGTDIESRTVDVHIAWLRQKLEENPNRPLYIQTIRGLGYKFKYGPK
jgi:two-component system alkaline phosphatase synthesis response regulator PhoP